MTLYTSKDLMVHRDDVGPGDIVLGEVISACQNVVILIDLLQRGVVFIPSPLAQLLSRSKVAQVDILGGFMHPFTVAVKRRRDLLNAMNAYVSAGIGPVVTKEEHMHCGHGVRKWDHIETVYSFRGLEKGGYPFVLQPLVERFADVRVIMIGDYLEAYTRCNPNNFRRNLSAGGDGAPCELTQEQVGFCRTIVDRAQFPYAHMDLQIMPDGRCHIFEITLDGGIRGSRLNRSDLEKRKTAQLNTLARRMTTN
jgi:glutathione synthase/RimK-type ligase-like ATP-grasp enzyme